MARWNKIDEMLNDLGSYRANGNWSEFFEKIEQIRSLDSDINDEMHNDPCDTTELDNAVKLKMGWLDLNKDKFAAMTNTQKEFDAVHGIVAEISDEFAHLA